MIFGMIGNLTKNALHGHYELPIQVVDHTGAVEHHPGNIERSRAWIGGNFARTETIGAPSTKLSQGDAVPDPAANVKNAVRR